MTRTNSLQNIKKKESLTNQNETQEIDRKIGKIGYQLFKSHLWNLALKVALLLGFSIVSIYATLKTPEISLAIPITIIIFFTNLIAVSAFLNRKKLLFDISLIYTIKTGGHDWWSPITNQIILGAIPLQSHLDRLQKSQVSHILTLLEPFELVPGLIKPIDQKTLKNRQINNRIIPCQDFKAVAIEKIDEAVEHIHEMTSQDSCKIYVHCKAGRGRSASVVIAYLLKYGNEGEKFKNFQEALRFVKNKRPQINLNSHQQKTIEEYFLNSTLQNFDTPFGEKLPTAK